MTDRTVRKFLTLLERAGMISRRKMSKGAGIVTHYTLHFDRLTPLPVETNRKSFPEGMRDSENPTKSIAPSGTPFPEAPGEKQGTFRKDTVRPSGKGVPVHREKPELTRRRLDRPVVSQRSVTLSSHSNETEPFETLWQSWPTIGRRRSKGRSKCFEAFKRATGKCSPADIVEAAKKFLRSSDPNFAPGLDRWLRDEKFEHFIETPNLFSGAGQELDWVSAFARFQIYGDWSHRRFGDRPDELGYRGPIELVETLISELPDGHPVKRNCRRMLDHRQRLSA